MTGFKFELPALMALVILASGISGCAPADAPAPTRYETIDGIEFLSPQMNELVSEDARIEVLAEGFDWSEGPLWVPGHDFLLFSDIPPNKVYRWEEGRDTSVYLMPSGYTGADPRGGEVGANGLTLDPEGRLVLCQHGDRRIARMEAPLDAPEPVYATVADTYEGRRLNSPNDLVYHSNGNLYFTDPPYGLEGYVDDPAKELDFHGVFLLRPDEPLILLVDTLSRPNGIAFSPDERTLYVANSHPESAIWAAYDVLDDGTVENGRIFYDATDHVPQERGLPDGMKVDTDGNIYATGPGGVWVFSPGGEHIGMIRTGEATSNVAIGEDGGALYITADSYLMRVQLNR